MKRIVVSIIGLILLNSLCMADPVPVTHWEFQAVNPDGSSSFTDLGIEKVILEGILLNSPEQWLNPAPNDIIAQWEMGGEWEIFVQGEGADHAGTFCWIGQNYSNGPGYENYTNEQWLSEICRINRDPNTGYIFQPGDRIRLIGKHLFYAGKLNINENHEIDDANNFTIELVKPAVGLPQPEPVKLYQLKDSSNNEIFDPTRMTGGEYYQARLVRIEDVNITNPENWGQNSTVTVADANGLTFPVVLCRGEGFLRYPCPTGQIDIVGIMDQKAPGYPQDPTKGYRLLVMNYDGNGLVIADHGYRRGNLAADVNKDYKVDFKDMAELADQWLENVAGLNGCD